MTVDQGVHWRELSRGTGHHADLRMGELQLKTDKQTSEPVKVDKALCGSFEQGSVDAAFREQRRQVASPA